MFINTGLLIRADHAGQVIGVIAHETGHIAGGHLSRLQEALKTTTAQTILAAVLAGAATIATGRGDLGQAILLGGQQVQLRSFLRYNRTQEAAADQAAMRFLDATGQSALGTAGVHPGPQRPGAAQRQAPGPICAFPSPGPRPHLEPRGPPRPFALFRDAVAAALWRDARAPAGQALRLHQALRAHGAPLPGNRPQPGGALRHGHRQLPQARPREGAAPDRRAHRRAPARPVLPRAQGQMLFENGRPAEALELYATAVALARARPCYAGDWPRSSWSSATRPSWARPSGTCVSPSAGSRIHRPPGASWPSPMGARGIWA